MDQTLDQQNWWDMLSCREWEDFLDEMAEPSDEEIEEQRIAALESEWENQHASGWC